MEVKYTIVIPTYNRYKNLNRLLDFFNETESEKFKILILDSSSIDMPKYIEHRIASSEQIEYKKFDSNIFFTQKLSEGVQHINTKYAVMCADDDFIFINAVEDCIDFLEINDDFSLAHGKFVLHSFENNKLIFENTYQKDRTIDNADYKKRLYEHCSLYYPTFYSVHRTEEMKLIFQKTCEYTNNFGLSEVLPSFISIMLGKKKVLNTLYSSRGKNKTAWIDFRHFLKLYSIRRLKKAKIGLANEIKFAHKVSLEEATEVSEKSIMLYAAPLIKSSRKGAVKDFVKALIPSFKPKLDIKKKFPLNIEELNDAELKYLKMVKTLLNKNMFEVEVEQTRKEYKLYK